MKAATESLRILGISGSFRQRSTNTGLLRAAAACVQQLGKEGVHVELIIYDSDRLRSIPIYDGDLEEKEKPEPVLHFRQHIEAADAVLFATPEYNHSFPGPLKNAIDWASRPWGPPEHPHPLDGKPAAVLGGAGVSGSSRAQYHLRQVLQSINVCVLPKPEVMVNVYIPGVCDQNGDLCHDPAKAEIKNLMAKLAAWTIQLNK